MSGCPDDGSAAADDGPSHRGSSPPSWTGSPTVSGGAIGWVAVGLCGLATIPAGLRWLRVAQREHYLPGSVSRFAFRWWGSRPSNVALGVGAFVCAGLAVQWPVAAIGTALAGAAGPIGLRLRTRTSALDWTPRLFRLAVVFAVLQAAIVAALGVLLRVPAVSALGAARLAADTGPRVRLTAPLEKRLVRPYVEQARARLAV